jgi:hypothetical protein
VARDCHDPTIRPDFPFSNHVRFSPKFGCAPFNIASRDERLE